MVNGLDSHTRVSRLNDHIQALAAISQLVPLLSVLCSRRLLLHSIYCDAALEAAKPALVAAASEG